jgi:hypothetical protein
MIDCVSCRAAFAPENDHDDFARDLETQFPDCICQQFSVGVGSPGPIADGEILYRAFVDPTDVDEKTMELARRAFEWAHRNGLSVFRESATDDDITALISDILTVRAGKKRKRVLALFRFVCRQIRSLTETRFPNGPRMFCVYDQTVPRIRKPELPHVPTHAGVFFRHMKPQNVGKRQLQKDCETVLYQVISRERVDVATFRNGLIENLNQQSLAGAFDIGQALS